MTKLNYASMLQTVLVDESQSLENARAAVDLYFLEEDGAMFKTSIVYEPYFLIVCKVMTIR